MRYCGHLVKVTVIECERQNLYTVSLAKFVRCFIDGFLVAGSNDQIAAGFSQDIGNVIAQAARTPGDDGYSAIESETC